MKIGIVCDGKFSDRAYEIIREKVPTEWITAPFTGARVTAFAAEMETIIDQKMNRG